MLFPRHAKLVLAFLIIVATIVGAAAAQEKTGTANDSLLEAARIGDTSRIRAALQDGAQINAKNSADKTALILAAEGGHMEAVRVLLRQNAAPNMQDNNGQTALFLATNATNEYLDIVQALLKNGAQPGIKNKSGKTALQTAVERDHANIVRLLLNTGRLSNTDRTDAFILAAVGAHRDSIAVFLDNGFDPNTTDGSGYTVLMRVAMQDNDNVGSAVKILVSAGADIHAKDSRGYTALAQAANVGSVRGVKALVENGASATDIEGRKAFWASVDGGRQYVVSLFMDYGANANLLDDSNGMTLLMVAAEKGHEGTTRALIKGGV